MFFIYTEKTVKAGMMALVLNGSPRKNGNTFAMTEILAVQLAELGYEVEEVDLFVKNLLGCNNCNRCQKEDLPLRCSIDDDMIGLYSKFLEADLVVIASPIYMWQLTPCTLAFLNRLHCLSRGTVDTNVMAGKRIALALTLGDEPECGDYAANGLRDFCEYFLLEYLGDLRLGWCPRNGTVMSERTGEIREFAERIA